MSESKVSNLTKRTLIEMFKQDKRFDGRKTLEFRDFSIEYNVSDKAEGSARVRLGKTEVVVGIKLQLGTPYPDSLDKGNLMVSGDLLPLASPRFDMGPPGFQAIELPRLVDRAIRESGIIDFKKLVIKEKELVWTVIIDVYPINDDGNLIDASSIAAVAALRNTYFPAIDENNKIDYHTKTKKKLPLLDEVHPISFSFFKIGDVVILDPTREEEEACDARVTFGISKWNNQYMLNSCQKSGELSFTQAEIDNMMDIISSKLDGISAKLKNFL
jgi:exosome complex component RRP42